MPFSRILNFMLIIAGASIILFTNADDSKSTYLSIFGLLLLIIGIYRTSRLIPNKNDDNDTNS